MKRKLWSVTRITHPKHPGLVVRVGEYQSGGTLHVFRWVHGKQVSRSLKCRRVDLGTTARQQEREARRLGAEFIEALAAAAQDGGDDDPTHPRRPRPWALPDLADATNGMGSPGARRGTSETPWPRYAVWRLRSAPICPLPRSNRPTSHVTSRRGWPRGMPQLGGVTWWRRASR
jgi:hypothetical protein